MERFREQLVTVRAFDRIFHLLAVCVVSSLCFFNGSPAKAAPSPGSAGQQSVSVEDVQRILAEDKDKADAKVARQLSGLELAERMSSPKLKSLEQIVPGTKSRWALVALADASVFLSPAAQDVVSEAAPDLDEQRRMLALTVEYLAKTLPKLPNFYAMRTIVRFEDDHRGKPTSAGSLDHSSWRQVGSSKVVVAYRDGKEIINPREWETHPDHLEGKGLITRGTFGPILSTVFVDAAHDGFTWSRWERGSAGTLAVFHYRVPKDRSHYSAGFYGLSSVEEDATHVTGYHGELAIDPATGTILRVTVQAEQPLGAPILQADIMVEYGPVEIGGKTYTCPLRSVSISMGAAPKMRFVGPFAESAPPPTTLVNDMVFDNYHQFRSESRILTGNIAAPDH